MGPLKTTLPFTNSITWIRIQVFILVIFSVDHIAAQQNLRVASSTISSLSTGSGKFYYGARNEPPRAIEFNERTITTSDFIGNINNYLGISSELTFIEVESNTDNLGMRHRLLQQYYNGVPIEGLLYRVHERDGFITSANGKAIRNIKLDTQAGLNEEAAFYLAIKYLDTKDTIFRSGKKLIVSKDFTFTHESFSIAFQFDIDVSLIESWRISIDAQTGQLINKISLVNSCFKEIEMAPRLPYATGTGSTNYYGNQTIRVEQLGTGSRLVGQTENGGIIGTYDFRNVSILSLTIFYQFHTVYDFFSSNNTYTSSYLKPAVSVQWAAEQAFEYYFKEHNRNSFDNLGSPIKSYVHVDQGLNNAFWLGGPKLMAFGDGSNNNPLVELDVVSHELTHGVTQYEAQLEYYNEPGALNESFSDILGKAVEFSVFTDTATWQFAKHHFEGGLRDMGNPNLKNQPDTYLGDLWYAGYEDSGGVHYNSGVQNFWFYLLCEGGSGINDHQVGYSVNAIGMDAATRITYRNLTEYLSKASDYLDSRIGSLLAASDLYGKNSTEYQEVEKAWDAVGVIDEPIITSLELYDITATTVKINGSLLPRGDTVTYHFEYGTTPALGSSSAIYNYTDKVEGIVTGLQSETKYYLRLVATNENGSSYADTEFNTISLAPLVEIKQTVDVTETTATLYGRINPNSLPTSFHFDYGLTPALGLATPSYPLSDTTEFLNVYANITDLQSRQTYYYKLIATNNSASSATESVSLFTAVKPVISSFTPVTAPIGIEVTITGQNFNPTPEKNVINFGATQANVLSSSSTKIKVKVPAGASLGPISLLDAESGLESESVQEFVPTFIGEFKKDDLQLRVGITDFIYQTLVSDMDGDNKVDIVARHYLGFSVFQNVNPGGDITEESFVRNIFPLEYTPGTFSLIDFDGNGLKDIVGRYQNGLRIYPNFSVPGYIFFGAPVDLPATFTLQHIVYSDFDQDGHIDIGGIVHMPGDTVMLTVFRNQNPKGSLSANNFEQRDIMILPHYVNNLCVDDLDNDGKPDLVIGLIDKTFIPILKNKSYPGTFEFEEVIIPDSNSERLPRYISQDLNQDGWKEIISRSSPGQIGNILVLENNGTSPNITVENPVVALSGYTQSVLQPADINGDGTVDMMVGINMGKFLFLKNNAVADEHISNSTFENSVEYGKYNSASSQSSMTINDLNGDGRPEIINTYSYNVLSQISYGMEIWQNSSNDCPDPSLISLINITNNSATILLPPNTTLDQFEIEYAPYNASYWWPVYSTTLNNLVINSSYKLRARAKCYLGFTDYAIINFTTDCVNTNNFKITDIGVNSIVFNRISFPSLEVQYSEKNMEQWRTVPPNASQITDLLPGTTYDLRIRGQCTVPAQFKYYQFTTLCPKLTSLTITDLVYNGAVVQWASNSTGDAFLEYSSNNVDWSPIDETQTISSLIPGKQYFVRGRFVCTNSNSDFSLTSFYTPCPKVSMITAEAVTPYSARINWIDESNTQDYIITHGMKAGVSFIRSETNSTFFDIDGLSPGTQYSVNVAPECLGTPDFTSIVFSTICFVPFNLSVNNITHTTAELSWSDNFSGSPYFIDYSISGSNIWHTKETTLTGFSLTGLRPVSSYEVRVHIKCISETAPYVSQVFETDAYEETTFAPNPTENRITIYPSRDLIGRHFSIHDNAGRKAADAILLNYTIDLSILSPGIYTLRIDGETPMKIIKY